MQHLKRMLLMIFICYACSYSFNLYHLSDTHFSDWNDTNSLNIIKSVNNAGDADVLVVSGDLVEVGSTYEYDFFNRYNIDFECPNTYFVAGNHETVISGTGGKFLFKHFLNQSLHWYHDIDNWRIIGLNNALNYIHESYVDETEMDWLENTLKEAQSNGKNCIVISHFFPIGSFGYSVIINEHELFTLLSKYNVKLFLCGHKHQNEMWVTNGVPVIPVGAAKYSYHAKYVIDGDKVDFILYKDTVDSVSRLLYNSDGEFQLDLKEYTTIDSSETPPYVITGSATITKLFQAPGIIYGAASIESDVAAFGATNGMVYTINADNGNPIDTVHFSAEASLSPVFYKGDLISFSDFGEIKCSDWQIDINDGISSQPRILGDKLIVGTPLGKLKTIDLTTGKVIDTCTPAEGYPIAGITIDGGKIYSADDQGYIFCYDDQLNRSWRTNTSPYPDWMDMYLAMSPTPPVVVGSKVMYARRDLDSSENIVLTGEMHAYNISDGSEAWIHKYDFATPGICALARYNSSILFCDGKNRLVALNPDNGSEEWNLPIGFEVGRMTVSGNYAVLSALQAGEMDIVDLKEKKAITRIFLCNEYILSEPALIGFAIYQTTFEGQVFKTVFDTTVDIKQEYTNNLLKTFDIKQNYPNPFKVATTIEYVLPEPAHTKLEIYNIRSQKVKTLVNSRQSAGKKQVIWDGKNNNGNVLAAGIYYSQIKTDKYTKIRKMILTR